MVTFLVFLGLFVVIVLFMLLGAWLSYKMCNCTDSREYISHFVAGWVVGLLLIGVASFFNNLYRVAHQLTH